MESVPLSAEIKAHAEVTPQGDKRAILESWVAKAKGLEAGAGEPETVEQHRAAGVAGLRKAIMARHIERLLVAKCFQRVMRLGLRDLRLN